MDRSRGLPHNHLQVATDPGVLSLAISAQFVSVGSQIETSDAVECQISGQLPSLGMSMVYAVVRSAVPDSGQVWSNRAPIIGFEFAP